MELMTYYTADQLLVLDETAKDRRNLRPNIGWGFRGITPYVRDWHLTRGGRISALTLFSSRGFEDWRMTKGTFNTSAFQAMRSTNVRADAIIFNSALSAYARNRLTLWKPAR
ncbi:hypothetical protein Ctob_016485 [Chrysochromulina tobinii]|uniref:Tc1-like transposase DDE domain-containing protein n=1 Tax=Chrysochromulina tobinii TaxID=1460289 RepID=A0A0M0KC28_9EUKA|nr:hypothetical protein Ctob_016485 [Chrysochromulina tobinii]|eukprot:KOO35943.1 hypothetical protein Ctob_016485 [Chrysochromulina sp. CCMP291]